MVLNRKRIEAFEMWTYRRMLGISWTDYITNEEILDRIEKAGWIGHIFFHDNLLHIIIEGMTEAKNVKGRPPRREYLEQLYEDMVCESYMELKRTAENRK